MKHIVALILFGAGAVLCAANQVRYGTACISGGLFVEAL